MLFLPFYVVSLLLQLLLLFVVVVVVKAAGVRGPVLIFFQPPQAGRR